MDEILKCDYSNKSCIFKAAPSCDAFYYTILDFSKLWMKLHLIFLTTKTELAFQYPFY